ncbi:AraC family transcriptional regulator [Lactobacillus sp. ESL0791]|uniref:AraC family transcriptional regulator n=1 Tax=Lactobacillus sp. ESL0791 TaxID=2983234 RepID=UPI0023F7D0C8|nr:AraC family transcriptional regulator [Lactobacillus sp. ESL0791]MDF7637848.1 AraC family transcriptional regulator [Lactobacillus sp. ESL0791]
MDKWEYWYNLCEHINIIEMGHIVTTNYHPKRNINFFIFGMVISGSRTIQVGNIKLFLKTGDYFLLPPSVPHSGIKLDRHDIYFIHFRCKYTLLKKKAKIMAKEIILPITGKVPKKMHLDEFFQYLNKDYASKKISKSLIELHFQSILSYISEYMQSLLNQSNQDLSLAESLNNFILENKCNNITAEDFEHHFNLSYKKLNNTFKKIYGKTIKQDFITQKITYASQLLLEGNKLIDTSEKVGYEDYFYFLKVFKHIKGMTPTQFLKYHYSK